MAPSDTGIGHPESEAVLRVFLHIPKTGGQTLRRMFLRRYGRASYFLLGPYRPDPGRPKPVTTRDSLDRVAALTPVERARLRVVGGHIQAGAIPRLPGLPRCFALVRDPVKRLVSLYRHARRKEKHSLWLDLQGMSLEAFAASAVTRQLDNDQTRRLAGVSEPGIEGEFSDTDAALLGRARANVARWFDLVGITERFDESLLLLQDAWGLRLPLYEAVNRAGANQRGEPPAARALGLLRERNALDLELHNEARALLQDRMARAGEPFQRRLRRFRWSNARYGPVLTFLDAVELRLPWLRPLLPR